MAGSPSAATAPRSKLFLRPAIGTGLVLLVPLVMTILDRGNPSGNGWHWGPEDFVAGGALLFLAGVACEYASRRIAGRASRVAVMGLIAMLVIGIWAELAVEGISKGLRLLLA
jgi:hypothetical protein